MLSNYSVDLRKSTSTMVTATAVDLRVPPKRNIRVRRPPLWFRTVSMFVILGIVFTPASRVYAQVEEEGVQMSPETAPQSDVQEDVEPVSAESAIEADVSENAPTPLEEVYEEVAEEVAEEAVTSPSVEENEEDVNEVVGEELTEEVEADVVNEDLSGSEENISVDEEESEDGVEDTTSGDGGAVPLDSAIEGEEGSTEDSAEEGAHEEMEVMEQEGEEVENTENEATETEIASFEEEVFEEDQTTIAESKNLSSSESQYVFDAADCVIVRSGEFYCVQGTNEASPTPSRRVSDSVAFSKKDSDGDLEIYLKYNGETIKVTNNTVDDDAPTFDPETQLLVWHTLKNERYQIMAYNPVGRVTYVVTENDTNNTHPFVHGDTVAWQAWEDDNWEIFQATLPPGLVGSSTPKRITTSSDHDMFPKVYKHFITWQSRSQNQWKSYAYDMVNGKTTYLGAGTNGGIESARVVLLVEKRNAKGDLETVGYELESGETIELGTDADDVPPPVIPTDPIQEQEGVLPSTTSATTTLKTSKDDDGDADSNPEIVE